MRRIICLLAFVNVWGPFALAQEDQVSDWLVVFSAEDINQRPSVLDYDVHPDIEDVTDAPIYLMPKPTPSEGTAVQSENEDDKSETSQRANSE